jgi:hypothetical protein
VEDRAGSDVERTPRHWKTRLRRVVTTVAVAILSLYALYVVALNVFLSTSLFEKVVDQDPESLLVTYERGWTIWPGTIHARKLSIRSSDNHVQFVLRIDACEFDLSFLDLARKKFHPTRVVGSGVTFDARQRIDGPLATPEYVDALPPVPGFERIPFKPPQPPDEAQTWNDEAYHLWTVHLEDVTAKDVRRIWIDTVRFEGQARIEGSFYLKPIRAVEVGPVHVDIASGRTTVKDRTLVEPMAGTVDARIRKLDPRYVAGKDLLHRVSLATDLHGRLPDLATMPRTFTGSARLSGHGELRRLALRIEDGVLVKDSHLDVAAPGATVEVARHRFGGDLALVADIPDQPGTARLSFRLDARSLTAKVAEDGEPHVFVSPALEITGDATSLDLAQPFEDAHVIADMPRGDVPDVRALQRYVPDDTPLGFERGGAHARAHVEAWVADRRAKADGRLEADDLELAVAKARVRGTTSVDGSVAAWYWEAKHLQGVTAKVHVATGSVASHRTPGRRVVDVRGLDIVADAADVELDDPMRAFHAKVDMPEAELVDRDLLRDYLPRGQKMQVAKGHARFDARCELEVVEHRGRGTVDVHSRRLGLTLEDLDLLADVRAHARVHDWAWEHGDLALDHATVDVTAVSATRHGADAAALTIPRVVIEAKSDRFAFADPLAHVALTGAITGGVLSDPYALDKFLPPGATVLFDADAAGARFEAHVDAVVDRRVARGTISARGQGLGIRAERVRVRGDVDAAAGVEDWRIDEGKMRVKSSRLTIAKATARFGDANRRREPDGDSPDLQAKRIELQLKTEDLDLAHPSLANVDYRLLLDDARMDDATRLGLLFPSTTAAAFAVESGRMRGDADIRVSRSERKASGGARLVLEQAGVRFHGTHLTGDFEVVAGVNGIDAGHDGVDISGSRITMRDVKTAGGSAETSAWNGDVELLQGALWASEAPAFDAFAQLHADNAKPLLAMVLGKSLPKFVVGLLSAKDLSGQARITVEDGRAAIRDAHVRGDDVVAYGDYVVVGDRVRGAVVVGKGPVTAGVKVDDKGTFVRLFGLESWRAEEKRAALALFAQGEAEARAQAEAKEQAKAKEPSNAKAKAAPSKQGDARER